jgi:hypothetical protein
VLPAAAAADERDQWLALARAWAEPDQPRTALDSELAALPAGAIWLLGWQNRFAGRVVAGLAHHGVSVTEEAVTIGGEEIPRSGHSLVLVARRADDPALALAWVAAAPAAAIPGLARKLPHYTRYSSLAFTGDEPVNIHKGMWPALDSPLARAVGDVTVEPLEPPERPPLAELPPAFDRDRLMAAVSILAGDEMEGRGLGSDGLERATTWVEARLADLDVEPVLAAGFRHAWRTTAGQPTRKMSLTNLVAEIPGSNPALDDRPVLVLAHLDHLGRGWPDVRHGNAGLVHPGADDNASGVAVLLELARTLAAEPSRARPVLLAVVTGEEAGRLGSIRLLDDLGDDHRPFACLNLDTVGRLVDGRLQVLNAGSAREWPHLFMGVGHVVGVDIAVATEPLDASDQVSCIEDGIAGVQLTTGPHPDYHRPTDTVDRIDADGLVTVTQVAHQAVAYLADRREPLTVGDRSQTTPSGPARRSSLGTMPDFAHPGPGVRVEAVRPGSPAESAGIRAGDVIFAIDDKEVDDLRGYARILADHAPGEEIEIHLQRGWDELTVSAVLERR